MSETKLYFNDEPMEVGPFEFSFELLTHAAFLDEIDRSVPITSRPVSGSVEITSENAKVMMAMFMGRYIETIDNGDGTYTHSVLNLDPLWPDIIE